MAEGEDKGKGRSLKRGISQKFSGMKESLVHKVESMADEEQEGLGEGDKAAMARLGSTLFDLVIHYVQTFSTISRSATAQRIWADWQLPDLFGWFTLDIFVLPVWDMPELGLGLQSKMVVLVLPLVFLYWVSEVVWSDSVQWRRDYVDEWAQTKKQLSPYHPLTPVFPSLVTGVAMSMSMLIFVVPKVTIAQGITTFLGFYLLQLMYGAGMLIVVSLAKVYYAEYRHETIDEDLPTEHVVDQRPDFFYGIRANARQSAQVLLGLFYLPLCVGVLHMVEEVRHVIDQSDEALPTCLLCNWYTEGIERYLLAVNVVQVSLLVVMFTVGAPFYMILVIKERRKHFVWLDANEADKLDAEHVDVGRDRRVVLRAVHGGSQLAQRVSKVATEEATAIDAAIGQKEVRAQTAHSRSTEHGEKGKWVWSPVSERPHREYDIFQLQDMVSEQKELGVPWFVAHRTIGKICCLCKRRLLKANHKQHGTAVRRSIEELDEATRQEWEFGYEDYQRKQGEMSGMDSLWMCCSQRWIYWKVHTGFFEKYILFALSANILSSMINEQCYSTFRAKFTVSNGFVPDQLEDGSWNSTTFTTEGSLDNRYTNNEYTAGLGIFDNGGSAGSDAGSWSHEYLVNRGCERVTAIGMLVFCAMMLLLGLICQPFLDVKQDKVDSACRFAGTSTSFALVLAVYEIFDEFYILLIVLIPNVLAIIYALYIINPGEMAAAVAVEIRSFLRARELGKKKKEEQELENNRRLFKGALAGDFEIVSETIKKYDDSLDINYKFAPKSAKEQAFKDAKDDEKSALLGFTAIHAAASKGNLRCLRELLNFGLYKYDNAKHDVPWTDPGGQTWNPIANPLQLAWEHGCSKVVALLTDVGFEIELVSAMEVLRDRLVDTLVPAGKHPERGAKDLIWILEDGIGETDPESDAPATTKVSDAVEKAMATLVLRHEWEGLAQFMFATKQDKLELWESWVNMGVIRAVSGICGELLKMVHVEAGTFTVKNVLEVADGATPFETLAMIFHGALEEDGSRAPDGAVREKSMRQMMQHVAHSATTFYIAGASRFMQHALKQSYKYVSKQFNSDHSQNPTQWTVTLNTRGTNYLDVFLTYKNRVTTGSKARPPDFVMASMLITCKFVSPLNKTNLCRPVQITTRTFEKNRELMVANFDLSQCAPRSGKELIEIRLCDVFVMDPIKEEPCKEAMHKGLRVRTMMAEWRLCGLPHMLPSGTGSSPELFIESNSMTTKHGTFRMALHVDEISQAPVAKDEMLEIDEEWFHERLQLLVGSDSAPVKGASKKENEARKKWKKVSRKMQDGDLRIVSLKQGNIELNSRGRVNALADVELPILSPMIIQALDLLDDEAHPRLRQLSFTENLSSTARKFVHMESKRRGLQHRSRTHKTTGARKLLVSKPQAGQDCDFPINIFIGNVGTKPAERQSFALRIEEERVEGADDDKSQSSSRVLINHCYLTDVSLDEDSTRTFGCYNMAHRSDLDGGDFPDSLVTIIRYQYDQKNRPPPQTPPKFKDREGEPLLRGSSEEHDLQSIFDDLMAVPSSIIPHSFALPEGTAAGIISQGRFFNRKKGETLAVDRDDFSDFIVLMSGAASTPPGAEEEKRWDYKNDCAIGNVRDFIYGCGMEHQHAAVATANCRIFSIRRSAALHAGGVGPAPRGFSPPAYQELIPEAELEARTTTVRWVLHDAPALLSDRSALVSEYFEVPQTEYNQCSWRLHIIPRDHVNRRLDVFPNHKAHKLFTTNSFDVPIYIGVLIGCTMHESLSGKQLESGTYQISAMTDVGTVSEREGSLIDGYPTEQQMLSDSEIGWGFTLGETWKGMAKHGRWEIEVKLAIDPKHSSGFGIGAVMSEAQWAVENSLALAQASVVGIGNLVGGIAVGGEEGKLGDRFIPKVGRSGDRKKGQSGVREVEFDTMDNPLADGSRLQSFDAGQNEDATSNGAATGVAGHTKNGSADDGDQLYSLAHNV